MGVCTVVSLLPSATVSLAGAVPIPCALKVTVYVLREGLRQPAIINAIARIKTREKSLFTSGSFKIDLFNTINMIKSKMQPTYKE